jgi:hypothetical protein
VAGTQIDQPVGIRRFAGEAVERGVGASSGIALSIGGIPGGPEDSGGVIQDAADAAEAVGGVPVPLGGVVALSVDSARAVDEAIGFQQHRGGGNGVVVADFADDGGQRTRQVSLFPNHFKLFHALQRIVIYSQNENRPQQSEPKS